MAKEDTVLRDSQGEEFRYDGPAWAKEDTLKKMFDTEGKRAKEAAKSDKEIQSVLEDILKENKAMNMANNLFQKKMAKFDSTYGVGGRRGGGGGGGGKLDFDTINERMRMDFANPLVSGAEKIGFGFEWLLIQTKKLGKGMGGIGWKGFIGAISAAAIGLFGFVGAAKGWWENYKRLNEQGIVFRETMGDGSTSMMELARQATNAGLRTEKFANMLSENAAVALTIGTESFGRVSQQVRESLVAFGQLGLSIDEVNSYMGGYLEMQRFSGVLTSMSDREKAKRSEQYLKTLTALTRVTGLSRDQLAETIKQGKENYAAQAYLMSLDEDTRKRVNEAQQGALAGLSAMGPAASQFMDDFGLALARGSFAATDLGAMLGQVGGQAELDQMNDLVHKVRNGLITEEEATKQAVKFVEMFQANSDQFGDVVAHMAAAGDESAKTIVDTSMYLQGRQIGNFNQEMKDRDLRAESLAKAFGNLEYMMENFALLIEKFFVGFFGEGDMREAMDAFVDQASETGIKLGKLLGEELPQWIDWFKELFTGPTWTTIKDSLQEMGAALVKFVDDWKNFDLKTALFGGTREVTRRGPAGKPVKVKETTPGLLGGDGIIGDAMKAAGGVLSGVWDFFKWVTGIDAFEAAAVIGGLGLLGGALVIIAGFAAAKLIKGAIVLGAMGAALALFAGGTAWALSHMAPDIVEGLNEFDNLKPSVASAMGKIFDHLANIDIKTILIGLAGGLGAMAAVGLGAGYVALGAAVTAASIAAIGAAIGLAAWITGGSLSTLAEGLDELASLDHDRLSAVGWAMTEVALGLGALGAGKIADAVGSAVGWFASFFDAGPYEKLKEIQGWTEGEDALDSVKIIENAKMLRLVGEALSSTNMTAGEGVGALFTALGDAVKAIAGTDIMDRIKDLNDLNVDADTVATNAVLVKTVAEAMNTDMTAGKGVGEFFSAIGDAIDKIMENDPIALMRELNDESFNNAVVEANAASLAQVVEVMNMIQGSAKADLGDMFGSMAGALARWFDKSNEQDPMAMMQRLAELQIDHAKVTGNINTLRDVMVVMGEMRGGLGENATAAGASFFGAMADYFSSWSDVFASDETDIYKVLEKLKEPLATEAQQEIIRMNIKTIGIAIEAIDVIRGGVLSNIGDAFASTFDAIGSVFGGIAWLIGTNENSPYRVIAKLKDPLATEAQQEIIRMNIKTIGIAIEAIELLQGHVVERTADGIANTVSGIGEIFGWIGGWFRSDDANPYKVLEKLSSNSLVEDVGQVKANIEHLKLAKQAVEIIDSTFAASTENKVSVDAFERKVDVMAKLGDLDTTNMSRLTAVIDQLAEAIIKLQKSMPEGGLDINTAPVGDSITVKTQPSASDRYLLLVNQTNRLLAEIRDNTGIEA